MRSRALIALGIGQCINWGILYYAFAVLLVPVQQQLGVAQWVVSGAFSLSLLVSAACAPMVGRWADRGHAGLAIEYGGYGAAALLTLWVFWPTTLMLYAVWTLLGVCMASTLYEPAFALIGRAHANAEQRLTALAALTVFGGFASTVFLPLTGWLVARLAWREAVMVLAVVLACSTLATRMFALRSIEEVPAESTPVATSGAAPHVPHFGLVVAAFALATFGSSALMSNIVTALGERSISPAFAATLGGLLGVMQVPGRALLMHGAIGTSPSRLVAISLGLQALGMFALATTTPSPLIALSIAVFAIGTGLSTLARPHLVQSLFGGSKAGVPNGQIARAQQLARAAGPVAATAIAATTGYALVFAAIGGLFALLTVAWLATTRQWAPVPQHGVAAAGFEPQPQPVPPVERLS